MGEWRSGGRVEQVAQDEGQVVDWVEGGVGETAAV